MMFLLTCDKKLTKSQLSPTHASTERKITDELKHNAGWYEITQGGKMSGSAAGSSAGIEDCPRILRRYSNAHLTTQKCTKTAQRKISNKKENLNQPRQSLFKFKSTLTFRYTLN